jgi:hypothetical protein
VKAIVTVYDGVEVVDWLRMPIELTVPSKVEEVPFIEMVTA